MRLDALWRADEKTTKARHEKDSHQCKRGHVYDDEKEEQKEDYKHEMLSEENMSDSETHRGFRSRREKYAHFKLDDDYNDTGSWEHERESGSRRGNRSIRSRQSRSRHAKNRASGSRPGNRDHRTEYRENRSRQRMRQQNREQGCHERTSVARLGTGGAGSGFTVSSKFPPIGTNTPDLG